jgi:recombinational DNA repair protein RecT
LKGWEKIMANEEGMVQVTADKIALLTGFKAEEIAIIKNTVAKGVSITELAYFLNVAKSVNLSPFNKEIWCYKDNKGNLLVFAGRDGFLKRAQESSLWNGMTSFEVCANDFFEMDVASGTVNHKPAFKDRGAIIGAYAIVRPKGCDLTTIEWADISVYDKKQFTWNTNKADMIKKVAEIHALKKAFGITILQSDMDWEVKDNVVIPVTVDIRSDIEIAEQKILEALDQYQGADKEDIKRTCVSHKKAGTFTIEFAKETGKILGVAI